MQPKLAGLNLRTTESAANALVFVREKTWWWWWCLKAISKQFSEKTLLGL